MPDDLATQIANAGIDNGGAVTDGSVPRASLALVEQALRDVDVALAGLRPSRDSDAAASLRRRRRELEDTLVRLRAGFAATVTAKVARKRAPTHRTRNGRAPIGEGHGRNDGRSGRRVNDPGSNEDQSS